MCVRVCACVRVCVCVCVCVCERERVLCVYVCLCSWEVSVVRACLWGEGVCVCYKKDGIDIVKKSYSSQLCPTEENLCAVTTANFE